MKPTVQEIGKALSIIWDCVPFRDGIPKKPESQAVITRLVWDFVSDRDHLQWLVTMGCGLRRFSVAELRGIYCTKYKPADGIEGYAEEHPECRYTESEARYLLAEAQETDRKIASWHAEAQRLLPGETMEPCPPLPQLKVVPKRKRKPQGVESERGRVILAEAERRLAEALKTTPKRSEEELRRMEEELRAKLGKVS